MRSDPASYVLEVLAHGVILHPRSESSLPARCVRHRCPGIPATISGVAPSLNLRSWHVDNLDRRAVRVATMEHERQQLETRTAHAQTATTLSATCWLGVYGMVNLSLRSHAKE
jgi:hypothetical protein